MALAPLSQTIFLTEDGSVPSGEKPVTIPPPLIDPPTITTPADIASDGTPQIGEPLTGIDPVATNATYGNRRWLSGDTVLARTASYTPTAAVDIDWVVDVIGKDGFTVLTSAKRITISAIPAPNPTIDNTLADSALPISAIPGLIDRLNALDDRLTALGLAAVDPDVADAIAAVLADLAGTIEAIDLHRSLAVVLPALEAAVTALEEATNGPAPVISYTLAFDGPPSAAPVQNFALGPAIGSPSEGGSTVQNFVNGAASGASEETAVQQNFVIGAPVAAPSEASSSIQNFAIASTPSANPAEGN